MSNTNIFTILSLLDYNNNILIENNLSHYIFNITNLNFLYYIKNESLSLSSCSIDGKLLNINKSITFLESNDNSESELSDLNEESNNSDSYLTITSNTSFNSYISNESFNELDDSDSDFEDSIKLSFNSNSECDLSELNELELTESSNELNELELNESEEILNNKNLKYIIQNDYDNFYYYICKLDQLKFKNISLYNKLNKQLIFINLQKIQDAFFNLLEFYKYS